MSEEKNEYVMPPPRSDPGIREQGADAESDADFDSEEIAESKGRMLPKNAGHTSETDDDTENEKGDSDPDNDDPSHTDSAARKQLDRHLRERAARVAREDGPELDRMQSALNEDGHSSSVETAMDPEQQEHQEQTAKLDQADARAETENQDQPGGERQEQQEERRNESGPESRDDREQTQDQEMERRTDEQRQDQRESWQDQRDEIQAQSDAQVKEAESQPELDRSPEQQQQPQPEQQQEQQQDAPQQEQQAEQQQEQQQDAPQQEQQAEQQQEQQQDTPQQEQQAEQQQEQQAEQQQEQQQDAPQQEQQTEPQEHAVDTDISDHGVEKDQGYFKQDLQEQAGIEATAAADMLFNPDGAFANVPNFDERLVREDIERDKSGDSKGADKEDKGEGRSIRETLGLSGDDDHGKSVRESLNEKDEGRSESKSQEHDKGPSR